MQMVVDVDESLLDLAERQARREGKPLSSLIEEALRAIVRNPQPSPGTRGDEEGGDADQAFFAALEEIRNLGRVPVLHRSVELD